MDKKTLQVLPSFYTDSPYAKYIIKELKDNSYGLVFNEFLHEIGAMLKVDVIYDQINQSQWLHADNSHMQIVLNKSEIEQFEFIPKTKEGEKLINMMSEKLLKENSKYIQFY